MAAWISYPDGWIRNHPDDSSYVFILPEGFRKQLQTIPANVLIDTTGTVSRLKFHRGNIGKVKTKNGKVIRYKAYDAREMSSIFSD